MVNKSGRHVFGSNRGRDSLVTLVIDQETVLLAPSSRASSLGKGPRFFATDPTADWLYATKESSDNIVGFSIDSSSGKLAQSGPVINTGSPVCILFKEGAA
jgi:6-phosphogluconolactonase (cycloisomerase 2 family)